MLTCFFHCLVIIPLTVHYRCFYSILWCAALSLVCRVFTDLCWDHSCVWGQLGWERAESRMASLVCLEVGRLPSWKTRLTSCGLFSSSRLHQDCLCGWWFQGSKQQDGKSQYPRLLPPVLGSSLLRSQWLRQVT